jgi:Glutamine amidotransferase domain
MCGIVGLASAHKNGFSVKEADAFLDMLYFDALRGVDSTGVFGVDKHANVEIHKEASHAANFLTTKTIKEFKSKLISHGLFAVGHNRAATRGDIKDENAHPFWVDDKIVLVQNGTWRGDHKKIKDTEVDTEVIAHLLAEESDVEKALSKVQAAYALVWFNVETKTLQMVRNYERPLWIGQTESGGLLWCSEPGFMQLAAMRHEVKLKEKPVQIDPHVLISLGIKDGGWVKTEQKVNPFRHYQSQNASLYDEEAGDDILGHYGWNIPRRYMPPVHQQQQQQQRHHCVPPDPEKVDKTFAEIAENLIKECHLDSYQHASEVQETINSSMSTNRTKKHLVELDDFLPANNNKQCTTWHVYGRLITADNSLAKESIVHWFVYKKTQDEMINYVTNGFYEVELAHCRLHRFEEGKFIVSVMCIKPEMIVQNAVH